MSTSKTATENFAGAVDGRWECRKEKGGDWVIYRAPRDWDREDPTYVATVHDCATMEAGEDADTHATARLLTAAPRLLRERDELREQVRVLRGIAADFEAICIEDGLDAQLADLRAALAKVQP